MTARQLRIDLPPVRPARRIVGWSMATSLAKQQLVIDALNMALVTRRPRGVIHPTRVRRVESSDRRNTTFVGLSADTGN